MRGTQIFDVFAAVFDVAREPIKDDAEFARALERVGTTIESRIRWLLKLDDRLKATGRLPEEQMKALRCEMAVFIDPMFDPKKGPVSLRAVGEADRSARQVCQGLQVLTRGEEWTRSRRASRTSWTAGIIWFPGDLRGARTTRSGSPRGI